MLVIVSYKKYENIFRLPYARDYYYFKNVIRKNDKLLCI